MRQLCFPSTLSRLAGTVLCLVLVEICALEQGNADSPLNVTLLHTTRVTGQVLPSMT